MPLPGKPKPAPVVADFEALPPPIHSCATTESWPFSSPLPHFLL
ncbi:Uncharacterised protein [Legionella pneumophila]|nr:Uncharacterised protein [Legionella pneumophila]